MVDVGRIGWFLRRTAKMAWRSDRLRVAIAVAGVGAGLTLFAHTIHLTVADDQNTNEIVDEETGSERDAVDRYPSWYGNHTERVLSVGVKVSGTSSVSATWRAEYSLTLSPGDPVVAEFRNGDWADTPERLTGLLGSVSVYPSDGQEQHDGFTAPTLTVDSENAVVKWGSVDDNPLDLQVATAVLVRYTTDETASPVSSASLRVEAQRFTVAGVHADLPPDGQRERVVVVPIRPGRSDDRVALVQDGYGSSAVSDLLGEQNHHATRDDGTSSAWIDDHGLVELLTSLVPWLLVLRARVGPGALVRWVRALAVAVIATGILAWWGDVDGQTVLTFVLFSVLAPLLVVVGLRAAARPRRALVYEPMILAACAVALILVVLRFTGWPWHAWVGALVVLASTVVWTVGAAVAAGRRRLVGWAVAATVATAGAVAAIKATDQGWLPYYVLQVVGATAWLLAATAAVAAVPRAMRSVWAVLGVFAAVALLVVHPLGLYAADEFVVRLFEFGLVSSEVSGAAAVSLTVLLSLVLAQRGRTSSALADPSVRSYALALVAIPTVALPSALYDLVGSWASAASAAVLVGGLAWLTPRSKSRPAFVLGGLSPAAHGLLLRRQLHDRVVLDGLTALYRGTKDSLASGEIDVAESARRRRLLEAAERTAALPSVLGSGGGRSPWDNGVAGAAAVLLLTFPVMAAATGIAIWRTGASFYFYPSLDPLQLAVLTLFWLRWGLYGLVFGYLYPRLRGGDPLAKALAFTVFVVLAETIGVVGGLGAISMAEAIEVMGTVVAPGIVMAAGLGLVWERRLTLEAGLPWRRVRRFGDLRSFSTPVVSIVVAVTSSAATSAISLLLSEASKGK
jgi:hypothetical protein